MKISDRTIDRISLCYLLIPFLVFFLGYLQVYFSLPLIGIFIFLVFRMWKSESHETYHKTSRKRWGLFLGIIMIWVFLSGIGGYAFQNTDFNGRNAIFRDLINYPWPVNYPGFGATTDASSSFHLVYYFGFWLVPALIGKLFGWLAGNFALYLYTTVGVGLVILLICRKLNTTLVKAALLLIFFSGMDVLGVVFRQSIFPLTYPTLWPPITNLEWWLPFSISSQTTSLFWVFNQAIPTWVCTSLIVNETDNRSTFLIWSLCFFFAPIPAIGLAILILTRMFNGPVINNDFLQRTFGKVRGYFTLENIIGGGLCAALSYFFIQSNPSSSQIIFTEVTPDLLFIIVLFSIFEWLLIWVIVAKNRRQDFSWYGVGLIFTFSVFVNVAGTYIFSHRSTIAPMFLLMLWSGELILQKKSRKSIALVLLLSIGAITPLYEINRSIYRTFEYYGSPRETRVVPGKCFVSQAERMSFPTRPEYDHPGELLSDDWYTLASFDLKYLPAYVADTSQSFFFKYLARK